MTFKDVGSSNEVPLTLLSLGLEAWVPPSFELLEALLQLVRMVLALTTPRSKGRSRFRRRPWTMDRTVGRCTSCTVNKWDWKVERLHQNHD